MGILKWHVRNLLRNRKQRQRGVENLYGNARVLDVRQDTAQPVAKRSRGRESKDVVPRVVATCNSVECTRVRGNLSTD